MEHEQQKQEEVQVQSQESTVAPGKKISCKEKACEIWQTQRKTVVAIAVLIVLIAASFAVAQYRKKVDVGPKVIKEKIERFVKDNVPEGTKTQIKDPVKEGDLYKVMVEVDSQEIPLYLTRDGKNLIQQVIDIDKATEDGKKQAEAAPKAEAEKKQAVPEVELFVMSYCPYGTQMEKGMLPVVKALGSKVNFKLRFVDYAMHSQKEIDENLVQYCIQKTQQPKLAAYLGCFLKKGEGTTKSCMQTAGVNAAQVSACVSETDKALSINEKAKDKSTWSNGQFPPFDVDKALNDQFGVQGSPTLVINGTQVNAGRDSASILKAVCSGFETQPKECEQKLSSEAPAPGFGDGKATTGGAASAAASCGQ